MAKEKSTLELNDEKSQLIAKRNGIVSKAKGEKRQLDETEGKEVDEISERLVDIDIELRALEAASKRSGKPHITTPTSKGFSFMRAVREAAIGGPYSDEVAQVVEAGNAEMRKAGLSGEGGLILPFEYRGDFVSAVVAGDGKEAVGEDVMNIMAPLRQNLTLVQAGATFMGGLVGNVRLPSYSGSTAAWEDEVASAKNGKGTFSAKTISPKRLTSFVDISKQFLAQESAGADAMLRMDIVNAIAAKLESTVFGKHAHANNMPDGFFLTAPTIKGAASYANIVDMESAVDVSNALVGNLSYIGHTASRGILKKALKAADSAAGFIVGPDGKLNGYPLLVSTGVASALQTGADEYGLVFGNWADYVIGQWGAIELTVDPYTKANEGTIRLVINSYFDAVARRDVSFKTASLK